MAPANSMKLASCIERSEGGVVPPCVTGVVVPVTVQATTVRTVVRVTTSLKEAMFTEADRKYFISINQLIIKTLHGERIPRVPFGKDYFKKGRAA